MGTTKMLHEIQLLWIRRSRSRDKITPVVIDRTWALLSQTVSAITKKWSNILFMCTSLLTVRVTWVLCVHTKGLVSTSRLRIIMSLVSVDLLHFPSLPYSGSSQIDRIKVSQTNHLQHLHKKTSINLLIADRATQLLMTVDWETTMAVGYTYQLLNLTYCKKLRYCYALCSYGKWLNE